MTYIIRNWTKEQAKKINVNVYPANDNRHKLEVYDKNNNLLAKIGAIGYLDYAQYLDMEKADIISEGSADKRRKLYYLRHKKEKGFYDPYSKSWLAKTLLW